MLQETQKITACLPRALLHDAQAFTGLGITETIKESLAQLIVAKAYDDVLQFQGKVKFSLSLEALRYDRED